jgi:hypothetical protein
MFAPIRLLHCGYVASFAALVIVLSAPQSSNGQRALVAPFLNVGFINMEPSIAQAQQMLLLAGFPSSPGMFGGGFGTFGARGFSGFGAGLGGFGGFPGGFGTGLGGFAGGFPGGFGGGLGGFGGFPGGFGAGLGGLGGFPGGFVGGLGGVGGGFAGKGFGGFSGLKAL